MQLPVEQNVFRQPHLFIEAAVTFQGFAPVSDVRRGNGPFESHRRAWNELLKLEQVSGQAAQASGCAVAQRSSNRRIIGFSMTSDHALKKIRPRDAVRINHQAERRLGCSNAGISRGACKSTALQMNEPDRRKLARDDLRRLIHRAIHDDHVIRYESLLIENGIEAVSYCLLGVVAGND